MSNLARRSPLSEFFGWLDTLPPTWSEERQMAVEFLQEDGQYVIRADLPGVDPDKDIEVSIDGDLLTIRGERREEARDKWHSEVRYGSFRRTVRLPAGCRSAEVTATYDDGVLRVAVPFDKEAAEPQRVPIGRQAD
jgi:HSP20 family molecular chaperone IbpA